MGFVGLIYLVVYDYLLPAADALRDADPRGRQTISAYSLLLLALVITILLIGLAMTFRIHRFFFPRSHEPRTRTPYVDAWQESARRMPTPPREVEEEP
jgi:hypothetical protein